MSLAMVRALALGIMSVSLVPNSACATRSAASTPSATPGEASIPSAQDAQASRRAQADARFETAARLAGEGRDGVVAAYSEYLEHHGEDAAEGDRPVAALLARGRAHHAAGSPDTARDDFGHALRRAQSLGIQPASESSDWPAEAKFWMAEIEFERLRGLETGADEPEVVEQQTRALLEGLQRTAEAYDDVLKWRRIRWALAALQRRAEAFEFGADAIVGMPLPKSLKAGSEEADAYTQIVDRQMQPFRNKALDLYRECVARGKAQGIDDAYTRAAAARLAELDPAS